MRATMWGQPAELRRLLADPAPAERIAREAQGRRLVLCGVGTSWHAAHHGAWLLREAGVTAWALAAHDLGLHGGILAADDLVLVLSHTGTTRFAVAAVERARTAGARVLTVGATGRGADVETVEPETSYAYTASHTGALARLAQLARALGADLPELEDVPDAVAEALAGEPPAVAPPARLLELVGMGPNAWTAAEGALKVRETSRVATEGLHAEQFLHGPSAALDERDALVALDGGGPGAARLAAIVAAPAAVGVPVTHVRATGLGEALSVFALTVAVQRIALAFAEELGTDPDRFGYERPGRREAWEAVGF